MIEIYLDDETRCLFDVAGVFAVLCSRTIHSSSAWPSSLSINVSDFPTHFRIKSECAIAPPILIERSWISRAWRSVTVNRFAGHFQVDVSGISTFLVGHNGSWIGSKSSCNDVDAKDYTEALLGPPLILAMALRDCWTLHASAAMIDGKLVLFMGESGNGKSTLARFLDSRPGWRRVADDIVPIVRTNIGLEAYPHFPQLKFSVEQQPSVGLPETISIHSVYKIATPNHSIRYVQSEALAGQESMAAVIRHTVASRLFDGPLLARHLDFAFHTANTVSIRRLSFPRDIDKLPTVADVIEADLV